MTATDMMAMLMPWMQQQSRTPDPNAGFVNPGISGTPNQAQIQAALSASPSLAGVAGDVTGVSSAQAPSPYGYGGYDTWDALGKMAAIVRQATGGGGGADQGMRQERFVHGQPQGQPAKVPDPRQSFNFTTMNNPMQSVGMFLLSPEGQRLIKGLQIMGAGNG